MLTPGDVLADRFQIERLAGAGGMGAVFRALDRRTGSPVALKVLKSGGDEPAKRFAREASVLAEMEHPAIVRHVAHGVTGEGRVYLAMEWLDGEDLAKRLGSGPLDVDAAVAVARRIAAALAFAHARGVIHRDIKPANVFLRGGRLDDVLVLDFGLARRVAGTSRLTLAGTAVGTPAYMSPEQARGGEVDARTDVYALGGVLFRCLTGEPPFRGKDMMSVLGRVLFEEPRRPSELRPDVPQPLDDLVLRALSKSPGRRPADGSAMTSLLEALASPAAPYTAPRPSSVLTTGEQVLVSVVAAAVPEAPEDGPTVSDDEWSSRAAPDGSRLPEIAARFGGRPERLANGALLVVFTGMPCATDQVAQAARCALAMQSAEAMALSIATGRGASGARLPVGDALDRATELLARAGEPAGPRTTVPVDGATADLLEERFEVQREGDAWELRRELSGPEAPRTLLGVSTPLVGRAAEMAWLSRLWGECARGASRAALVTGPAGSGKSRLRIEFLRQARQHATGPQIWIGRGKPMGEKAPFGLLAEAIRSLAGIHEGEPARERYDKLRERVGRNMNDEDAGRVAAFLGELLGAAPDPPPAALAAARTDPLWMGDQIRRAWEDLLTAECAVAPVLLALDNLQHADASTLRLVDGALAALADEPFMVLGLARPEIDAAHPNLWSERGALRLPLAELTREACATLVRHVLGDRVPDAAVERVVSRAGGNAFYLEELVRSVAHGKGDALPATAVAMAQARVERLDAESRRVLRAASVFGRVFWRGGVAALLPPELPETELAARLDLLATEEVIAPRPTSTFAGEEELVFRSELIERASYAMLTESDRSLGHELAGSWLERAGERDAGVLAAHFERGNAPARAAPHCARAAQMLLEANDWDAAVALAERGIACGAAGEVRAALRLVEAEAHHHAGDHALAETKALEALCNLPRGDSRWCAALGFMAAASAALGERRAVVEYADTVRERVDAGDVSAPLLAAAAHVAQGLVFVGRYDDARRLLARLKKEGRPVLAREPSVEARLEYAGALSAQVAGDVAGHLELSSRAADKFEGAGDHRRACLQLVAVGSGRTELGDYEGAEAALRSAIERANRMRLRRLEAVARANLGIVLARLGSIAAALVEARAAVALFAAQSDARLSGGARAYLASILVQAGELDEAEAEARGALESLKAHPSTRCLVLGILAEVRLAQGEPGDALGATTTAMALLDALGGVEEGEAIARLAHARALAGVGRTEEFRQAIAIARDRIAARAAKIADPRLRASFLERIREHVQTFALAAEGSPPT